MASIRINTEVVMKSLYGFTIYIDEVKIAKMQSKESETFKIESGEHELQVKYGGALKKSEKYKFFINDNELFIFNVLFTGVRYKIEQDYSALDVSKDNIISINNNSSELKKIILEIEGNDEIVFIALRGIFREYLICTNKCVYIIKKGFMTGHFLGKGNFHIQYDKITNVEIDMHILTGYFEISTGGLENKRLNYWSSDANFDPAKQPNCIALNKSLVKCFEKARSFILNYEDYFKKENTTLSESNVEKSIPEQIREYKELLDDGIISKNEFEEKKKELLSR